MSTSEQLRFFIVTPSYNQAQFLAKTLSSVYPQLGTLDQYFVADGGSNDKSPVILTKFTVSKNNFGFYSRQDGGQVQAINYGRSKMFEWAKQNKIALKKILFMYLNSDDMLEPGALEDIRHVFNKNPDKAWAVGDSRIVDASDKEIQALVRKYKSINRKLISLLGWHWLYILNPIPQPSVVIRGNAVAKIGAFNPSLKYTMDYEYWLRLSKEYGLPIFSSQVWSDFRIHATSLGTLDFRKQFNEQLQVAQQQGANHTWLLGQKLHNSLITSSYSRIKTHG